ncbi:dihydrodipicolinate synthase family protein [Natribacillus halophilus]|uniref:4-hydroxy-tetrahydrodipicolinate synthase n=1 Tax=Natribacillus halophilus TaxID=549003 RepID=A0A1G8R931_9BACI|nr:dihydrodipicolinate synthase family protein [Natribacillus halophilus]SDJ13468.1 4-hydroxy-tetrahydrodipicolinate synthase [Natribacillus halophilus]
MAKFEGVYVAILTPFTEDYEVDFNRLREITDWMIGEGVQGIVPTGSLGEYATMTTEERASVVETIVEVTAGRVPVVVGTGAPSTAQAVYWAQHAKDLGAAGIMALPPINYNALENEVIAHYEALAEVDIPIIAYNNPRDYKIDLTPTLLKKISKFPQVIGVKEFSGDIRRVHDILDQTDLEVMIGLDDLAMEGALSGATGWISGVPNALPREGVQLFELARKGNIREALPLYRELLPLFHLDASPQLVQYIKHMMTLAGQPVGPSRPPRLPLDTESYRVVEEAFKRAKSQQSVPR